MKGGEEIVVDNLLLLTATSPQVSPKGFDVNGASSNKSFDTFLANSTMNEAVAADEPEDSLTLLMKQAKAILKSMQQNELLDDQLVIDDLSFEQLFPLIQELLQLAQEDDVFLDENNDAMIDSLLAQLEDHEEHTTHDANPFVHFITMDTAQRVDVTNENYKQAMQLLDAIKRALQMSQNKESAHQVSKHVLRLLQQWSQLSTKLNAPDLNALMNEQLTDKEEAIWRQLVQTFTNRLALNKQNMYATDSNITRSDVMQWLQQANDRYLTAQVTDGHVLLNTQGAMSQIEQYVIHVQDSDRVERISSELMQKFEQVIRSSRFVQGPQSQQLSIMLRPEHLGNMTVRFAQIDGEMTVKIVVSTQLAKEMLESNIHQLKHLFAPHQVSIERDETVSDKEFFGELYEEEEHEEEQTEETFEEQADEELDDDFDFQSFLNELQKEA